MDYFTLGTIRGTRVDLVPISMAHVAELELLGAHDDIWRYMPTRHSEPGSMDAFVRTALELYRTRRAVPYATLDKVSGQLAGSTRFHFIEPEQRRLEIGMTWVGPQFQRSHVNTEAKLLQLWYAFEVLGARRMEWKADASNARSRAAIARLGAKEEGYFRKHMIYPDGRNRDSVYFGMIDDEWPDAKARLVARLGYPVEPSFLPVESSE